MTMLIIIVNTNIKPGWGVCMHRGRRLVNKLQMSIVSCMEIAYVDR